MRNPPKTYEEAFALLAQAASAWRTVANILLGMVIGIAVDPLLWKLLWWMLQGKAVSVH